jgi:hypothetical protein
LSPAGSFARNMNPPIPVTPIAASRAKPARP